MTESHNRLSAANEHEPVLKKLRFTRDVMKRARMDGKSCLMSIWEQDLQGVEEAIEILSSDGGVESGHANASGSGPLPEPVPNGDACSALEPPHQAAETVGRYQELKRAAGVTTGPSDHTFTPAQSEKVPVVWAAFTERGYVRFWTTDETQAAGSGLDVKPCTVDDLMRMVVRASAAQPPAAPVEDKRTLTETVADIRKMVAEHGGLMHEVEEVEIPGFTIDALSKQASRLHPADQHKLAEMIAANVGYELMPEPPHPDCPHERSSAGNGSEPMDAGSIFTFLRERMEDETSASLAVACRALVDHLRVLRAVPQTTWQPIETAPKDGTPIEVCNTRHPEAPPVIVRWDERGLSADLFEPHWCDAATRAGDALYYNQNYFDFWKPTTALPRPKLGSDQ